MLQIAYDSKAPPLHTLDCLALFLAEDTLTAPAVLPAALAAQMRRAVQAKEFEGKHSQVCTLVPAGSGQPALLLVGLGKRGELTREALRRAA
ncbi:MAG TPA: M17 family peptidase N-terminal domain-containing protein, partial [bacterium]|nr:M17 family peptidase N-terminal domain-containing protein [bacterium]